MVQDLGFLVLKTGPSLVLKTGPIFSLFSPFYNAWGACLKTQIVSHCAKIVFLQNFGDVKMRVSTRKFILVFCFFRLEK